MTCPEALLPKRLLSQASLRGREYSWPVDIIPQVIDAARTAMLVNIGGQLQFRFPDGTTCECYWIEVDALKLVAGDLPWAEKVAMSADTALAEFHKVQSRWQFVEEGKKVFPKWITEFEASGGDLQNAMCFVWYLESNNEKP